MWSWGDQPVDVFEEEFVAEAFSGAGKLNHGTGLSSHKFRAAERLQSAELKS